MPIRQTTTRAAIEQYTEQRLELLRRATLRQFAYLGELCVNQARSAGSYRDQTGNLRSSVGYVVSVDGRVVQQSGFSAVKGGGSGSHSGANYAKQLAGRFPKGISLIVVAGMNYAAYVSAKGYDVLDSSQLLAERQVGRILTQLGFR